MDFTGHGRSEGELHDATNQRMFNDLQIVYHNVCQLNEVDEKQIGLVGSEIGVLLSMELAQKLPGISAMVLRSPLTGNEIRTLENIDASTLIIHASQEESITAEDAKQLPSRHAFVEIPDATRLFNDPISLEMMIGASVEWLADHLTGIPTNALSSPEGESVEDEP